ncbi:MAG: histidine kinase, partial [Candidatus Riflebacteria bacterium]
MKSASEAVGGKTVVWKLNERVKELTTLHRASSILQKDVGGMNQTLQRLTNMLPAGWQYPVITVARIFFKDEKFFSPGFRESAWCQSAEFMTKAGHKGRLDIFYLEERPIFDEGPFLKEERALINSVSRMLKSYCEQKLFKMALRRANQRLEEEVRLRTHELKQTNAALQEENAVRRKAERKILSYQQRLRRLVAEMATTEERERRKLATELHDEIGQNLAALKLSIQKSRDRLKKGEDISDECVRVADLIDETIRVVRGLTHQISPPALYEFGLVPALEALAENLGSLHPVVISVKNQGDPVNLPECFHGTLFSAVRELLINVIKHAQTEKARVRLTWLPRFLKIKVEDRGVGFDIANLANHSSEKGCFGLFNLKE